MGTMQQILSTFGIRNVPVAMLTVMLGIEHEESISFHRLCESCVRVCGASRDIRSFMLQFDVAKLHTEAIYRIRELAKRLDYVAADGSCHTSIPPPCAPLVLGLPDSVKGDDHVISKLVDVEGFDASIKLEVKDGSRHEAIHAFGKHIDLSDARNAHLEANAA